MKTNFIGILLLGVSILFSACHKEEQLAILNTAAITSITDSSAVSGGQILESRGGEIRSRGVVWSTSPNPSLENNANATSDGSGEGSFASNLTGLQAFTTYYIRAYATNNVGTAYGNELSFTTTAGNLASLSTLPIVNLTSTGAITGGEITDDGGSPISQRGIAWSTQPNPTLNSNITIDGTGMGSFTSSISGLTANMTIYVRAYAVNSAGYAYGNELSFTTPDWFGSITSLDCNNATTNGTLTFWTAANGVSSTVPYTGGNGVAHNGQTVTSTGVAGLTATLPAGNFATGSGNLTYTITGTPNSSGTASFALNIGGQNCTLNLTVTGGIESSPGPGITYGGYTYPTVILGNGQEWMAENLRTTQYNNGTDIPLVTDQQQWSSNFDLITTNPMMCWYNNDEAANTANNVGALYNWFAVSPLYNGNRNVCPVGWHVPTNAEWTLLTDYLGGEFVAGGKMKSTGTQYWLSPNAGATNESGFSALPAGYRDAGGDFYTYDPQFGPTNVGLWWSRSQYDPGPTGASHARGVSNVNEWCTDSWLDKTMGVSVRCIRD